MNRHLLSELSLLKVYSEKSIFLTGDSVTIDVYANGSGTITPVDSNVCTQIGTTGVFHFDMGQITTTPTTFTEFYWIMSNGVSTFDSGVLYVGGWPESVPQALTPASSCLVTTTFYEADGATTIDPNILSKQSELENAIELKTAFSDGSRYFRLDKFAPSYNEQTGVATWTLPRLSTVNVQLVSFGVTKTNAIVPDVSTIDLKTWLDSL